MTHVKNLILVNINRIICQWIFGHDWNWQSPASVVTDRLILSFHWDVYFLFWFCEKLSEGDRVNNDDIEVLIRNMAKGIFTDLSGNVFSWIFLRETGVGTGCCHVLAAGPSITRSWRVRFMTSRFIYRIKIWIITVTCVYIIHVNYNDYTL